MSWARTHNIEYNILRPTNNYGKYQYPEKLIPLAVKLLQRNMKIRLHEKGLPIRTWLHVNDTSRAVQKIMEAGTANEIYNISGGFEQSNITTVKKIIKSYDNGYNWEEHVDLNFSRRGQDVRYSLDDSKIRKLGWAPEENFDQQIVEIIDFYKKHFIW